MSHANKYNLIIYYMPSLRKPTLRPKPRTPTSMSPTPKSPTPKSPTGRSRSRSPARRSEMPLPANLLDRVSRHLSYKDLGSFRQSCKGHSTAVGVQESQKYIENMSKNITDIIDLYHKLTRLPFINENESKLSINNIKDQDVGKIVKNVLDTTELNIDIELRLSKDDIHTATF